MPKMTTVYWRDIPAQVIVKRGRESAKVMLSHRFQAAIDRAAMRAGKGSSDKYMEDWRRVPETASGPMEDAAKAQAERLEAAFDDALLERMVKAGGRAVGDEG